MSTLFVIGRVAFVAIFIFSGATKLIDITATAAMIEKRVILPDALADVTAQLVNLTGMAMPQLLAIAAGALEFACGLLIAFGVGTRGVALLLALFTVATTYYFHDFWNMAGEARSSNMIHALKNLSLIGGLLMLSAIGSWRPAAHQRAA